MPWEPLLASDSQSPTVPTMGPLPRSFGAWRGMSLHVLGPSPIQRNLHPGTQARPERQQPPHPTLHHSIVGNLGEPGAKPFLDDLLLGWGFACSRAALSLRSIESQPSIQKFGKRNKVIKISV